MKITGILISKILKKGIIKMILDKSNTRITIAKNDNFI